MGATVSRRLVGLFLPLALLWPTVHAAPAAPAFTITYAEQAARLVRDTSLFRAGRGVVLREHDLLESGSGAIQLDGGGATVAIGPASRVWIRNAGDIVLLDGWLKLRTNAGQAVTVATANLALAGAGTTVAVHAAGGSSELFAESGAVLVHELDAGRRKRAASVPHEHFAVRARALPLRLADRPPPAFLGAMPRSFRDELVPLAVTSAAVTPRHERAASFAELGPWLAAHPTLRRQVQARFDPPRPARPAPRALPPLGN
jgi:hypothetical protein